MPITTFTASATTAKSVTRGVTHYDWTASAARILTLNSVYCSTPNTIDTSIFSTTSNYLFMQGFDLTGINTALTVVGLEFGPYMAGGGGVVETAQIVIADGLAGANQAPVTPAGITNQTPIGGPNSLMGLSSISAAVLQADPLWGLALAVQPEIIGFVGHVASVISFSVDFCPVTFYLSDTTTPPVPVALGMGAMRYVPGFGVKGRDPITRKG